MTRGFTSEELKRLGLEHVKLESSVSIDWPYQDVGEGLVKEAILSAVIAFLPVQSPDVTGSGIKTELALDRPGVFRVSAPGGQALSVTGDVQAQPDERVPGSVRFQLQGDGIALCELPNGRFLIIRPSVGGIEKGPELVSGIRTLLPLQIEALAAIAPPTWIGEETDQWLREIAAREASGGSSWHSGVAVGMLARLRELDSRQTPAVQLAAVMRGKGPGTFEKARQWAKNLSSNERETLKDLGMAEIDALHFVMDDLSESCDPESDQWRTDFADLCRRRDDLECVRLLLSVCNESESLEIALISLDESARELMFSLPEIPVLEGDERLRRVAVLDDTAWWVRSVAR